MEKKEKAKREKSKYSHLSNIGYILRRIWGWERGMMVARTLSIPLSVLQALTLIYFPKLLIDLITKQSGIQSMLTGIVAVCFILLVCDICMRATNAKAQSARYSVNFHLQDITNDKYLTTDYENIDDPGLETIRQRATDWPTCLACEFFPDDMSRFLTNLLGSVTYGSMIALVSPWILLLLIVSGVISYLALGWVRRFNDKANKARAPIDRKVSYIGGLSTQFEYAKDVRLYNMFGWLSGIMTKCQGEQLSWIKKGEMKSGTAAFVNVLLQLIRDGAAYAVLISLLLAGKLELGNFVLYLGAITGFSTWLSTIIQDFNGILDKSMRIGYVREYLEIPDKQNHGPGCPMPSPSEVPFSIDFTDFSYRYPGAEKPVLDDITVRIKAGEKIAIVGENGAGKTTLVKNLCGLYRPSEGTVTVNNRPVQDYNIENYYRLYTVVFQDIYLLPLPIANFIASSNHDVDRERVRWALEQTGLWKAVEIMKHGMDTVLMKGIYEDSVDLSGGEQQKLMLARALYKDAPVLILDEPTAALDPIAESELYEKYNELTAGKTVFFISHRLASTRFCDRIFFIADGKIAECGSHEELLALGGKYAYMWGIQSHYYQENLGTQEEGAFA